MNLQLDQNQSKMLLLQEQKQIILTEKSKINFELDMINEKIDSLVNLKKEDSQKNKTFGELLTKIYREITRCELLEKEGKQEDEQNDDTKRWVHRLP